MTIQTLRDVDNSPILHSSWSLTISDIVIVSNFKSASNCPQHSAAPKNCHDKKICVKNIGWRKKKQSKKSKKKRKPKTKKKNPNPPLKPKNPRWVVFFSENPGDFFQPCLHLHFLNFFVCIIFKFSRFLPN